MIKRIVAYIVSAIMTFATGIYDRFDEKIETGEQYEKLWTAINASNEQAMIEAINDGEDINKFKHNNCGTISPVIWACHVQSKKRFINTMLKYDLDPDLVDVSGSTVFCEVVNECEEAYEKLLSLNPNVNFVDDDGNNVIYYALSSDYFLPQRVQDIVDKGAIVTDDNINYLVEKIEDYKGSYEEKISYINALKILIDNYCGEDIDKNLYEAYNGNFNKNKCKSNIVLYGIAGYCSKNILEENLKSDSDLDFLLRVSIMADNLDNIKYLLAQGANIDDNDPDECNKNALYYAVKYNNYDIAEYIVHLNADAIDECVYEAVINNNLEILKLLLNNGANLNNKEAFEKALINNYDDIVKCFVERGFDVNSYDRFNVDIYYVWVFSYCDLDTVKYIHEYSNKLNADELHKAMRNSVVQGNLELLLYLKELGADFSKDYVNSSNGSRLDSQLMVATRNGYFDVVKFLVENGSGTNNYTADELEHLTEQAKTSDNIYNYLTNNGVI